MTDITLTPKQKRKITNAVKALNDTRQELQEQNPNHNINWYLEDSNNLNLMEANSHDENYKPQHDRVIEHFCLDVAGGGGW